MEARSFLSLLASVRPAPKRPTPGSETDETVPYFCRARLLTVTTVDAATAVVARAAVLEGQPLAPVIDAWAARTPSAGARATSRAQGRDVLERARDDLPGLPESYDSLPRPVALGVIAAEAGFDAEALARMIGFDDVQSILASAESTDASVWSQTLLPDIKAMATQVAHLVDPTRIPATGAPVFAAAH